MRSKDKKNPNPIYQNVDLDIFDGVKWTKPTVGEANGRLKRGRQ